MSADRPPPSEAAPRPFARVLLGIAVVLFALSAVAPVVILLAAVVAIGIIVVAVMLIGDLYPFRDSELFAVGHWTGMAVLLGLLIGGSVYSAHARKRGATSAVVQAPIASVGVLLVAATIVLLRFARDATPLGVAAVAVLTADFYYFTAFATFGLFRLGIAACRGSYAWAAAARYRTGLVTGVLSVALVPLLAIGNPSSRASATSDGRTPLQILFRILDPIIEPAPTDPPRLPAAPTPAPSLVGSAPITVGSAQSEQPSAAEGQAVRDCLTTLSPTATDVQRRIQYKFRISNDDALDIARDALLNVCAKHAKKPYDNVAAVLESAATRRAVGDWRRRKKLNCAIDVDLDTLPCVPVTTEFERAAQIDRILDAVRCKEDPTTEAVIYLHVRDGATFPAIESQLGLAPNHARYRFDNFVNRARKRLQSSCGD